MGVTAGIEEGAPVRLSELLGALSYALDLTEGQPAGHCVRASWIGVRIGRAMGLTDAELWNLSYAVLLKDLGCSSNAARICQLYLADDLGFKRDFKQVGDQLSHVVGFVLSHTGLKAGLADRFRAMLFVFQNGGQVSRELIETRCQRGASIARRLRFPDSVSQAIASLDEHWDGGGKPEGLAGPAIPTFSQIALLAQVVDVFATSAGPDAAVDEVRRRSGTWFDPRVVRAFEGIAADRRFWAGLRSPTIGHDLAAEAAPGSGHAVDDDYLDDVADAFAQVVDSKSPFTSGHSERVALYADMIAEEMGVTPRTRRRLKRAALLHDIGKLGVSNMILDKPGKLDDREWVAMRRHAEYSAEILTRIGAFEGAAAIGGQHHERLDGRGYPYGLDAGRIGTETRIVSVADVFDALTADRPYRAALPLDRALSIMAADVGHAFDPDCFAALGRALERIGPRMAA